MTWLRNAILIGVLCVGSSLAFAQVTTPLSVQIVPAATGNCPATPPPQATAAGFTKRAYCLDGASAFTANLDNWLKCPDTNAITPAWWLGANGSSLTCHQMFSQTTDPASGKTVLDLHWPGSPPGNSIMTMLTCSSSGCTGPLGPQDIEWPAGYYIEIRTRVTPPPPPRTPHDFSPSIFAWHNAHQCNTGFADAGQGPIEYDYYEFNGASGSSTDQAFHDWGMCNVGQGLATGTLGSDTITITNVTGQLPDQFDPTHNIFPSCIDGPGISHRALFTWTVTGTSTLNVTLANTDYLAFSPGNLPVTLSNTPITWGYCSTGYWVGRYSSFSNNDMHTYGALQTTDGSTYVQQCGYVDNVLAPVPPGSLVGYGGVNNCGEEHYVKEAYHYTEPHHLVFWGGTPGNPNPSDQYIEYIAQWTCPNGIPGGTDRTCAGPKILPSTIDVIR